MSDQLLQQIFEKLVEVDKRISNIENTMATKVELEEIRKNMATKKDVEELPWIKAAIQEINQRTLEMQERQEEVADRQNIQRSLIAENAEDVQILKEDVWQLRKNA